MRKRFMKILLTLAAVFASLPAWAAQGAGDHPGYGGWGHMMDWGWGPMMFGGLMMVVFWGGIIFAIVLAVVWLGGAASHGAAPPTSRKSALDILQERFAHGEIDKDEFEERKRLLSD